MMGLSLMTALRFLHPFPRSCSSARRVGCSGVAHGTVLGDITASPFPSPREARSSHREEEGDGDDGPVVPLCEGWHGTGGAGSCLPPLHPPLSYCSRLNSLWARWLLVHMEAILERTGRRSWGPWLQMSPSLLLGWGGILSSCCCSFPQAWGMERRLPELPTGFSSSSELEMEVVPSILPGASTQCPALRHESSVPILGTHPARRAVWGVPCLISFPLSCFSPRVWFLAAAILN